VTTSTRVLAIDFLAIGLLAASAIPCKAQLTGVIEADRIEFVNGKPTAAAGTGTIKNKTGDIVASGKLIINEGAMAILGRKGAVFTYAPQPTTILSPTNWPVKAPANVALVDFDGKSMWTLKDDQFLFLLDVGGNFQANILVDNSLLLSSRIGFPEGTYSMWGYSITVGAGGGAVVFRQNHLVDGANANVETPEKKRLEFPLKAK